MIRWLTIVYKEGLVLLYKLSFMEENFGRPIIVNVNSGLVTKTSTDYL